MGERLRGVWWHRHTQSLITLALAAQLAACFAQKVVVLGAPPAATDAPADFSAVDLVIQPFMVESDGVRFAEDSYLREPFMRQQFADYLRSRSAFANVYVDLGEGGVNPRMDLDLKVVTRLETSRTWVFDILAVGTMGLWPFSPQWGNAVVTATATATDVRTQQVFHHATVASVPYSLYFFTVYRTNAIEEALRAAYEQAFTDIADALAQDRNNVLARLSRKLKAPRRLAVLPVQRTDKLTEELPSLLDEYVLAAVPKQAGGNTLSVADINALLTLERQKDLAGCDDASCAAELAGALDVDLLLVVGVANVDGTWMATGKLIDVRLPRVEARATQAFEGGHKALMTGLPELVRQVFAAAR